MSNVSIYIDGQLMTLGGDQALPFALTFSLSEKDTPDSISGARSKRYVTFPADKVNTEFFKYWHEAAIRSDRSADLGNTGADIKPARVEYGGIPVFNGVAQLEEVYLTSGQSARAPSSFRVSFFGNNATWFNQIKNLQIRSLGLLPRHKNEKTVIEARVNTNNDPDVETWGYTVIRTVDWLTPGVVRWQEMTPFIYIRSIIISAFDSIGFTINSALLDTYFFKRLILPCPFVRYPEIDMQYASITYYDLNNTTAVNNSTFTIIKLTGSDILYDANLNYDIFSGNYTAPVQGFYRIEIYKDRTAGGNTYTHRVQVNTVEQAQFTTPGESFASIDPNLTVQGRIYLDAGDLVALIAKSNDPLGIGEALLIIRPDENQEYDPNIENFVLDFSQYGNPAWTVGAMLLDLTLMFNLIWDTDYELQRIRVECRDDVKLSTGRLADAPETVPGFYKSAAPKDLTAKVDISKRAEVIAENATPSVYELGYLNDNRDANTQALDAGADLKVYDSRFFFDTRRYKQQTNRVLTKFFAKTVHVWEPDIFTDTDPAKSVYIPAMQAKRFGEVQTERVEFAPRILFHEGIEYTSTADIKIVVTNPVGSGIVNQDLPLSWFVAYDDQTGFATGGQSLSFSDEGNFGGGLFSFTGLLKTFHYRSIARAEEGRRVKEWIFWNAIDIMNLSFRDRVYLFGRTYILETIDGYIPGRNGSTQTILIAENIFQTIDSVGSGIAGRIPLQRDI